LVPELSVSDLVRSVGFYVELLGFRVEYERPEEKFAALSLGSAHLMLEEARSFHRASESEFAAGQWRTAELEAPFGRGIHFEIEVSEIATLRSRLSSHGYPVLLDLHEKTYRVGTGSVLVRQMLLADPDGYLIRPSQRLLISVAD
jgi:catechol 2,3-dioxygenase-like lactoylglutathione lyase family enzyme